MLEGRRKPEDEDVGKAAHAYGVRTACFPCIFENFLRFLTQVKANASCISECREQATPIQPQNYNFFLRYQLFNVVTRRNFLSAGRKRHADETEVTTFDSVKPRRAKGFIARIQLKYVKV